MDWHQYLRANGARFQEELLDFLRIPSISALPENASDVRAAAEWLERRLTSAGVNEARVLETGGHPVVYGEWTGAPGKPTVLLYGHFDVQPVDPLHEWETPPFEPTIRDGRVYARGATDDKGNLFLSILAVEALLKTAGGLPVNVKFLLEGQEEIGSPQLGAFLAKNKELFGCDVIVSADGGRLGEDPPALIIGTKGICALSIDVRGAKSELDSGIYGGAVANPVHALVQILGSMRGADGRILVEGFYDDVAALSEVDRERIAVAPFDEAAYKQQLGVEEVFGEPGYSTLERAWARPTLEINGLWGGFQGEGMKTVLPAEAHAKVSCRLVADQDPQRVLECLTRHIHAHTPPGVRVSVTPHPGSSRAYFVPAEHPGNRAAQAAVEDLLDKDPYYARLGGTVPVYELLQRELGAYAIAFGWGSNDEGQHAPNEFWRLKSFELGQRGYCILLEKLAEMLPVGAAPHA